MAVASRSANDIDPPSGRCEPGEEAVLRPGIASPSSKNVFLPLTRAYEVREYQATTNDISLGFAPDMKPPSPGGFCVSRPWA